ncbi:putative tRNA (adenine-N -)-methyltransferase non-catalytic subunit [Rosellinia necatrix]|uniref:tRNA (adenine(58)-N(1))-methyltransferase non-catalytic subunit TRM6 n=1 Tax=Rosellinia necatrix TaxID=77044 RepID=A0A1S7UKS7_ROSNE|nr:putative tRNA (adenine-N -)-methyltransferase non-catalytic subunit [Rosellinia necatrix]
MHSLVQPNAWVALRLPSGNLRVLQVAPNTTISLGKYGSFPTNLIIQRPYHLTYELQDRRLDENFNRLRIVPATELYADILADGASAPTSEDATPAPDAEGAERGAPAAVEYSLVDPDSGAIVATTDSAEIDAEARQTLTVDEIEAMKKDGTDAGRELIAKLMLSHTGIDKKTEYSLAKYKLLKTKKYIRRFSVLPLDVPMLDYWTLEDKDASKILDMRDEMIALLGCWANVHFGGTDPCEAKPMTKIDQAEEDADTNMEELEAGQTSAPGRWLVVDDTGGLLVAAMAERMGILYAPKTHTPNQEQRGPKPPIQGDPANQQHTVPKDVEGSGHPNVPDNADAETTRESRVVMQPKSPQATYKRPIENGKHRRDEAAPYAHANTITHIHANAQPNLSFLRYYDFDVTNPPHASNHPLTRHLMNLSWLQLLEPDLDNTYNSPPPSATPEEIYSWKTNRRSSYHRKRRRWVKTRHAVDTTRQGGFSGLVVASVMDPVSIMRHAVPLLAGGAPIAIYSQSVEALTELADCYSLGRRAAWATGMPEELGGMTLEEQEQWAGNDDFPLNPSLVLGASVQTSRVRKWQVLPGRTHPLMSGKGGAEGYVFTAWRVKPAEGKVEARGKLRSRKRKVDDQSVA